MRRGLAEFQGCIDHGLPDLRRLAASLHAQLGRHGEAVEWAWQDFAVVPSVEGYQRLREYGEADGSWVFCRQIEAAAEVTKRDGYEQAVSLLKEVSGCYERVSASAEFADYVRRLRAAHRRKRNFIAALDAARLPG